MWTIGLELPLKHLRHTEGSSTRGKGQMVLPLLPKFTPCLSWPMSSTQEEQEAWYCYCYCLFLHLLLWHYYCRVLCCQETPRAASAHLSGAIKEPGTTVLHEHTAHPPFLQDACQAAAAASLPLCSPVPNRPVSVCGPGVGDTCFTQNWYFSLDSFTVSGSAFLFWCFIYTMQKPKNTANVKTDKCENIWFIMIFKICVPGHKYSHCSALGSTEECIILLYPKSIVGFHTWSERPSCQPTS